MDINVKIGAKALIQKDGKFLVLKKAGKGTEDDLGWETPGGHMDHQDESLEECLLREVKEETGVEINILNIFRTFTNKDRSTETFVGINYLCEYQSGNVVLSDEHYDHRWLTIEEISKLDKCLGLQKEINSYLSLWKTLSPKKKRKLKLPKLKNIWVKWWR